MSDPVSKPAHYAGAYGVECKDAMANMMDRLVKNRRFISPSSAYWWGMAFKYLWRWPEKNGVEDIDKAIECLSNLKASIRRRLQNG